MQLITQTPQRGPSPTQVVGLLGGGLPQLYAQGRMPMRYARGGVARRQRYGLASAAEQLRRKGRNGDTILAHINPQEAGILKLLGGSGKINPHTGLPEFGFFDFVGDVFSGAGDLIGDVVDWGGDVLGDIGGGIMDLANSIAEGLGPIGQIAATYFGGPIGGAIYGGFAAPGDDFDLGSAGRAALMAELTGGAGDTTASFEYADEFGGDPFGLSTSTPPPPPTPAELQLANIPAAATDLPPPITYDGSGIGEPIGEFAEAPTSDVGAAVADAGAAPITDISVPFDPVAYNAISTGQGVADLGSAGLEALKNINLKDLKTMAQLGAAGMTAYGGYSALQEQKKMKAEAERLRAAQEKKRAEQQAFAESVLKRYPLNYRNFTAEDVTRYGMAIGGSVPPAMPMANIFDRDDGMAGGGIIDLLKNFQNIPFLSKFFNVQTAQPTPQQIALEPLKNNLLNFRHLTAEDVKKYGMAKGGVTPIPTMPPRFLSGGGDGMSDSIPANIEGKQEARLADGEFVIPADVVSHIGNGSSNAGAKKLYAMMDRVRQARTGKERQAPQVNTRRLLPA